MINDRSWATIKVLDHRAGGIDSKVMIDRGQEVTGRTSTFDGVLATFVSGTDEPTGFNSTASPDV